MASNPVNLHLKKINYVWLQNNVKKGNHYWSKEGMLRCSSWNSLLLMLLFTPVTDQRAFAEELPASINRKLVVSLLSQQALTFVSEQLHSSRRGSSVKIAYIQSVAIIFAQFQVPELFYAHNCPLVWYCILIAYREKIVKLANPNLGSNSQNGHKSVLFYLVSQQGTITCTKRDLDHQHMERIWKCHRIRETLSTFFH